jgi:uncharacterized protein (TIGR02594 family)
MNASPLWYTAAAAEIGKREIGNNEGPYIEQLIAEAKCGHIHDPWCAIFVNAKLEICGLHGSRSASSQSFRSDTNFRQLTGPALGAIAVFWRNSKRSGLGHVGFYDGENSVGVNVISGNSGDMVNRKVFPKDAAKFGLIGYWWPSTVAGPVIGKLPIVKSSGVSGKVV